MDVGFPPRKNKKGAYRERCAARMLPKRKDISESAKESILKKNRHGLTLLAKDARAATFQTLRSMVGYGAFQNEVEF
jgi:hypothetical protein